MKIVHVLQKYRHTSWQMKPTTTYLSYEYQATLRALKEYGGGKYEIVPFFYDVVMMEKGKKRMNEEFLLFIEKEKPDFVLFNIGGTEFEKATIKKITDIGIVTLCWMSDDSWRFDSVSKKFAPYCSWVITGLSKLLPKYRALGCGAIYALGGVQENLFKPISPEKKDIGVSFVGTFNHERDNAVAALRSAGIPVFVRGKGWEEGDVRTEEMADIIARSKISLILNPAAFYFGLKPLIRLFFKRPEMGSPIRWLGIEPDFWNFFENIREWWQKRIRQIKWRHFETLACRTLGITLYADDLEKQYEIGKEIVVYKDIPDLVEKVRYYLAHDEEREAIAEAGYRRTMKDHTISKRLENIFKTIGLEA